MEADNHIIAHSLQIDLLHSTIDDELRDALYQLRKQLIVLIENV